MRWSPAIVLVAAASVFISGCDRERQVSAKNIDPSQVKVEEAPDANLFHVPNPKEFPIVTAELRPTADTVHATGVVAPDVSRTVPVVSMSAGRVIEVNARLGDYVRKGQLLLKISSPDVAGAIADSEKAEADAVLAKRQLERSELLYSRGAIALKDLQVAEDTDVKAKADVGAARRRLQILGADADHPNPVLDIRAPVSGTIVEQNVTGAAGVRSLDNSPNLFTIADLSRVWILCDVFENDISKIHAGDGAEVRMNAYPERLLHGRVSNIGSILDPQTRAAKVRLEIDNPAGMLRPNMFATAMFRSRSTKMRPIIPTSAVLRLHDKSWVFRPEPNGKFRRQEIETGATTPDGRIEVISGLNQGDRVVSNALQLSSAIDNQ